MFVQSKPAIACDRTGACHAGHWTTAWTSPGGGRTRSQSSSPPRPWCEGPPHLVCPASLAIVIDMVMVWKQWTTSHVSIIFPSPHHPPFTVVWWGWRYWINNNYTKILLNLRLTLTETYWSWSLTLYFAFPHEGRYDKWRGIIISLCCGSEVHCEYPGCLWEAVALVLSGCGTAQSSQDTGIGQCRHSLPLGYWLWGKLTQTF